MPRTARNQRAAAIAYLAARSHLERVPPPLATREPWGALVPRAFAAMLVTIAIALPTLTAALMRLGRVAARTSGDKTTALFKPADYPPGAANVPAELLSTAASWRVDADGSGGLTMTTGSGTASETGAGDSPSDKTAYSYDFGSASSTGYAGGKGHILAAQTAPGTGDFVVSLHDLNLAEASAGELVAKQVAAGAGWTVTVQSGPVLRMNVDDGTTSVDIDSATIAAAHIPLATCYVDRSGSAQWHVAGATSGSAVAVSAATDTLGASVAVEFGTSGKAWLGRAELHLPTLTGHDNSTTEATRYAQATGQYLAKATGTRAATTLASRSGHAFLRKEDATLGTLWVPVGDDVPVIEHDSDGLLSYSPVEAQTCWPWRNGDLSAWTKRGSASVAAMTGQDGATRNCLVTVGAGGFDDIYDPHYNSGLSSVGFGVSVWRPPGGTGVLVFTNALSPSIGRWNVDLSQLTEGAWTEIKDASHVAVTEVTAWDVSGGGQAGVLIYGSSGTVTAGVGFPTLVADGEYTRPVLTGAAYRTTGAETWPAIADAANIPHDGLKMTADIAILADVDASDADIAEISDGGATAERVRLRINGTGDAARTTTTTGSSDVADVTGTTDVADGTRRKLVAYVKTDDVRTLVDGASEGTPDTSAALPSGLDTLEFGVAGYALYSLRVEAL